MSTIAIQKVRPTEGEPPCSFQSVQELFDDVQRRAFVLFEQRGGLPGLELDDWFRAERELLWSPAELIEKEKEFHVRIAVPGLDAKQIQVAVTPESVIVRAEAAQKRDHDGAVRFSEFRERKMFRRFDLTAAIDVDKVTATVDKGMLHITATKAAAPRGKKIAVAA